MDLNLNHYTGGLFMTKALINVDYTYDFVADDGKLTCGKPGQDIEQKMVEFPEEFVTNGDFLAYGIYAYEDDERIHPESALFPPYSIIVTPGMELDGKL